jgi:hypothetical protein
VLSFLLALINPISAIAGDIAKYKIAQQNAQTDQERIHAQEMIETLRARRDVMMAEAAGPFGWINALMRGLLAIGPMIYLNKIFIWDKVLGLGSTDALDSNLWNVVMAVIGFYFLYEVTARWKR